MSYIYYFRVNNNVQDHVAMQAETTENKSGKANTPKNKLSPYHVDIHEKYVNKLFCKTLLLLNLLLYDID